MDLFIILKTGVHMQGIGGVCDDPEVAVKAATVLIRAEPDDYHQFDVVRVRANLLPPKSDGPGPQGDWRRKENIVATLKRFDPEGYPRFYLDGSEATALRAKLASQVEVEVERFAV